MTIRLLRVFLSRSDYQGHFQAKIGNAAHIEAFSEHPVGTANLNWPTRWGNEQAALRPPHAMPITEPTTTYCSSVCLPLWILYSVRRAVIVQR